jgi:hypothetical protein
VDQGASPPGAFTAGPGPGGEKSGIAGGLGARRPGGTGSCCSHAIEAIELGNLIESKEGCLRRCVLRTNSWLNVHGPMWATPENEKNVEQPPPAVL